MPWKRPRAFPKVKTCSPRCNFDESPNFKYGKFFFEVTFNIATSFIGSWAISFAGYSSLSLVTTVCVLPGSDTTCLFVRTIPLLSTKNPDPPSI